MLKKVVPRLYEIGWESCALFTLCRQKKTQFFPSHFHTTCGPPFRASLYTQQRGQSDLNGSDAKGKDYDWGCEIHHGIRGERLGVTLFKFKGVRYLESIMD